MTPRGRTNQLIYQAELLLAVERGDDEHAAARRMAADEGALALLEVALNAALREVTEHARLPRHDWRELLVEPDESVAELEWLRALSQRPDSWLATLMARIDALHDTEGAARREADASLIASADRVALADELLWCAREFKALLGELRETSAEW